MKDYKCENTIGEGKLHLTWITTRRLVISYRFHYPNEGSNRIPDLFPCPSSGVCVYVRITFNSSILLDKLYTMTPLSDRDPLSYLCLGVEWYVIGFTWRCNNMCQYIIQYHKPARLRR